MVLCLFPKNISQSFSFLLSLFIIYLTIYLTLFISIYLSLGIHIYIRLFINVYHIVHLKSCVTRNELINIVERLMFTPISCTTNHHHHIALVARISLTLSRHSSLSFIALGRSSEQHPVSSHSC